MNIKAMLHDNILVERISDQEGLIVAPDVARKPSRLAKVLMVGPGRWVDGVFTKTVVKPGDIVCIPGYGGQHPDYDCGDDRIVVQERDIGGILG